MKPFFPTLVFAIAIACNNTQQSGQMEYRIIGSIDRIDPALDTIVDVDAKAEVIAEGFEWSEGPLWVESEQMLLFSDVPKNTVYKWTEENGTEIYLQPSGYTTAAPSNRKEPGSNGLLLDHSGNLVLCQHGDRQVAKMDAPLDRPEAKFVTIAGNYDGKRFSSPNDAVYSGAGELFFTDPPYGLPRQSDDDPAKEIPFNGVYRVAPSGKVSLVIDSLTRPNGLAFFPGETKLLVANSDPEKPNWYLIDIGPDGTRTPARIFYSTAHEREGLNGLPDGLKIDKNGTVFASGPGGVWIFNSEGKVLGKIVLEESVSNVALSADEKTLYITNDTYVLRVKLR